MEAGSERVCYVHCNFCNTVLTVSVPLPSMLNIVTVKCGHCANFLSVNMGDLILPSPIQTYPQRKQHHIDTEGATNNVNYSTGSTSTSSSPSKCKNNTIKISGRCPSTESNQLPRLPLPVRPAEKRQRVPSAYNRFIKEEIQRIKASNPDISHREAFSAAAKNWAHLPNIHFGLKKAKVGD